MEPHRSLLCTGGHSDQNWKKARGGYSYVSLMKRSHTTGSPTYTEMGIHSGLTRPLDVLHASFLSPAECDIYSNNGMLIKLLEGLREMRHVFSLQYCFLNKPNKLFTRLCLIEQASECTQVSSLQIPSQISTGTYQSI